MQVTTRPSKADKNWHSIESLNCPNTEHANEWIRHLQNLFSNIICNIFPISKRKYWTKKWLFERRKFSHTNIARELKPADFRNFIIVDSNSISELLNLVVPLIEKQVTIMRGSVPARERLIVNKVFSNRS